MFKNITEELDGSTTAANEHKIQEKVYSVDFNEVTLETERPVLENVTFKVKANEKMGMSYILIHFKIYK